MNHILRLALLLAAVSTGCSPTVESPTAPAAPRAMVRIDSLTATALRRVSVLDPFTYRLSLVLRESGGVDAMILGVGVLVIGTSGSRTETQFSAAEAFGATQVSANDTVAARGMTVTSLSAAHEIHIEVGFAHPNSQGSALNATLGGPFNEE